ncbi:MAG: DNA polymerase III subunit gamma/tau [Dehalococcoidia bacterium]|nr:DNA polymerase III subunit gamma/tau [Dehalococcoidia bacterium]
MEEVVGQEPVTKTLKRALETGRVAHAYLFCGPRGTGKTSTGRILAKAVNCLTNGKGEPCNNCASCLAVTEGTSLDVIEIDAASNRGIDNIRDLREKAGYSPSQARFKVYIVDEVHQLTGPAFSALLKTLEEPPPHIIFILATTEAHIVPATILSRCQRFDFRRLSQTAVLSRLKHICEREGINIDEEALKLINRAATGSLRDAENILEQMVASFGREINVSQVIQALGLSSDARVRELAGHVLNRNIQAGLYNINKALQDGLDLRQYNRELVNYLRKLMLTKGEAIEIAEITEEELREIQKLVVSISLSDILRAAKVFGSVDLRLDSYSPLPLELALIECSLAETLPENLKAAPAAQRTSPVQRQVRTAPQEKPARAAREAPVALPPVTPVPRESVVAEKPAAPSTAPPKPDIQQETARPVPLISGIEQLKSFWKDILASAPAEIKKTPALAILRSGCIPVSMEDETIVLEFRHNQHKERLERDANRQVVENLLNKHLDRPCKIHCVVQNVEDIPLVKDALGRGAVIHSVESK